MAIQKILITSGLASDTGKTTIFNSMARLLNDRQRIGFLRRAQDVQPDEEGLSEIVTSLALLDDGKVALIDLSGEKFRAWMDSSKLFGGGVEGDLDRIVVPITPYQKPETVFAAVDELIARGAAPKKIVVVLNRVPADQPKKLAKLAMLLSFLCAERGVRLCAEPISEVSILSSGSLKGFKGAIKQLLAD